MYLGNAHDAKWLLLCQFKFGIGKVSISRVESKPLQLSDQQRESIRILKDVFRNNFEHYIPLSWSIEVHGLPQLVIDVLEVIRFLALDSGNYVHLNQSQKRRVRSVIFQSKRILKRSQLYREAKLVKNLDPKL